MGDNFESEQKDWGTALWLFSQPHSQRQACVPTDRFIGTHLIGWVLGLADDPVPLGGLAAVLLVSALPLILPALPTHPAACNLLNLGNFQKKVKEDLATETVLLHIITSLIADSGLPFEPVNPRRPCHWEEETLDHVLYLFLPKVTYSKSHPWRDGSGHLSLSSLCYPGTGGK